MNEAVAFTMKIEKRQLRFFIKELGIKRFVYISVKLQRKIYKRSFEKDDI